MRSGHGGEPQSSTDLYRRLRRSRAVGRSDRALAWRQVRVPRTGTCVVDGRGPGRRANPKAASGSEAPDLKAATTRPAAVASMYRSSAVGALGAAGLSFDLAGACRSLRRHWEAPRGLEGLKRLLQLPDSDRACHRFCLGPHPLHVPHRRLGDGDPAGDKRVRLPQQATERPRVAPTRAGRSPAGGRAPREGHARDRPCPAGN